MIAEAGLPADPGTIADWCEKQLGSAPTQSYISDFPAPQRWGFKLADQRRVAVAVQQRSERLLAYRAAHEQAHRAGILCPKPLAGPDPLGEGNDLVVLADAWRTDGAIWPTADPAGSYGRLQARLVAALAEVDPAPLAPPPPWLRYDHRAASRLWPTVESDRQDPERITRQLPTGLYRSAEAAREKLLSVRLPAAIGHGRLSGLNVRWLEETADSSSGIVHGWEYLSARPEAVLVGYLMATFNELPRQLRIAPVTEGRRVLAKYQQIRERDFTEEETQIAWATSTWVACYFAAMEHVRGAPGQVTHQIVADAAVRQHLAGI